MKPFWTSKKRKIHSRDIKISTYQYDRNRLVVEGSLRDNRFQNSYIMTGEKFSRGVIHHMIIRLLINCSDLAIEDVQVEMTTVPSERCREIAGCLAPIKGLTVSKGFTQKVKKIAGGVRGCTHLVELLLTMAPAVIQGYATHQSRKPSSLDTQRAVAMLHFLTNTCFAWREDGPFVRKFKEKLEKKK